MKYLRHIDNKIKNHFQKYKEVIVLLGSRQTGKTTLVRRIFPKATYLLVDNEPVLKMLESYDINTYQNALADKKKEIIIDEIHLLSNPGRAAKIIYDQMPGIKLIITGSASFSIKNKTSESLAGRKIEYCLYPLTFSEYLFQKRIIKKLDFNIFEKIINNKKDKVAYLFDVKTILNDILLYGQYPNLVNLPRDKEYLLNFIDSLIFKDILDLKLIEDRKLALNILKLLAYQIGNLINYSELADKVKASQQTIKRYIEIFEQSFILFLLYPFSKNRRDEIVKSPKIYFYDTGLRNALINDFADLSLRPDRGALWENFIITECLKANNYLGARYSLNFWRTRQDSEVDLVLSKKGEIIGAEIKYKAKGVNKAFMNRYKQAKFVSINSENFY